MNVLRLPAGTKYFECKSLFHGPSHDLRTPCRRILHPRPKITLTWNFQVDRRYFRLRNYRTLSLSPLFAIPHVCLSVWAKCLEVRAPRMTWLSCSSYTINNYNIGSRGNKSGFGGRGGEGGVRNRPLPLPPHAPPRKGHVVTGRMTKVSNKCGRSLHHSYPLLDWRRLAMMLKNTPFTVYARQPAYRGALRACVSFTVTMTVVELDHNMRGGKNFISRKLGPYHIAFEWLDTHEAL